MELRADGLDVHYRPADLSDAAASRDVVEETIVRAGVASTC
jgi:hypothetical protein